MDRYSYKITPTDSRLPIWYIEVIENYVIYIDEAPCPEERRCGFWWRTGLNRAHKKGRKEVKKLIAKELRLQARKAMVKTPDSEQSRSGIYSVNYETKSL